MAYTDPTLDSTIPSQSEKVKLGASRIRNLTRAISQRLASVFVDPNVDPLALKPNTVGTTQLVDGAVTNAEIADATIELAKLSVAAKAGLYKMTTFEKIPALIEVNSTIPVDGSYAAIVSTGTLNVDKAVIFYGVKQTNLTPALLSQLVIHAYGIAGNTVNLAIGNRSPTATVDITGTTFFINVFTPVP